MSGTRKAPMAWVVEVEEVAEGEGVVGGVLFEE